MSQTNTDIQLKRSQNTLSELADISLQFAEPLFVDNCEYDANGTLTDPVKAYLVVGRKPADDTEGVTVEKSPVFKALSQDNVDNLVFYNSDDGSITNEAGTQIPVNRITTISKTTDDLDSSDTSKYYLLCQTADDDVVYKFTLDELGIFINGRGIMKGAAWNDYAETRSFIGQAPLPGQIVCDDGYGNVALSTEKYQACAHVVSDTYGQLIGELTETTVPIAVAGKVLVALADDDIEIGDCICAGANGLGRKMTRQEIANYPDRIIGVVCEFPRTQFVGSIEVDGRVWINVK